MPYCRICGQKLEDDSVFCVSCGTPVKREENQIVDSHDNHPEPANEKMTEIDTDDSINVSNNEDLRESGTGSEDSLGSDPIIIKNELDSDMLPTKQKTRKGLIIAVVALSSVLFSVLIFMGVYYAVCMNKTNLTDDLSAYGSYPKDDNSVGSEIVRSINSNDKIIGFPDWYEPYKAVVKDNMICDSIFCHLSINGNNMSISLNDSLNGSIYRISIVRLYIFDDNEHAICEYSWFCFEDEESAKEYYDSLMSDPSFHNKKEVRLDGKAIALNVGFPELDSIMYDNNYKSYSEITKKEVIEFVYSTDHEVIYK